MEEVSGFKDDLIFYSLPRKLLMRLTILVSGVMRSQSDLCTPLNELIRLVRLYSSSWEEKVVVLREIQGQQESKQKQVTIALKKIELLASESEKLEQERAANNWAMLFSKVLMGKSHGRRWKFRIENFKKNAESSFSKFNPFGLSSQDGRSSWENERDRKTKTTSDADSEGDSLSARHSSLLSRRDLKKAKFSTELSTTPQVKVAAPPKPVMVDKMVSTGDVNYAGFLLVRLYHPLEVVKDKDAVCTVKYQKEVYQSKTFTPTSPSAERDFHDFHLELSDADLKSVRIPNILEEGSSTKTAPSLGLLKEGAISVSVFAEFPSKSPVATAQIRMSKAKLEGPPSVVVPPVDRGQVFDVGWDYIAAVLREDDAELYLCEGGSPFKLKILCHLVKIQKHPKCHAGTSTLPLDECVSALGFKKLKEVRSRATSARRTDVLERGVVTSLVWEGGTDNQKVATPPPPSPQEEKVSAEEVAEMALVHAKELEAIQDQYEAKLEELTKSLGKLRQEKVRQEEEFQAHEQELIAQFNSQLNDQESTRKLKAKFSKKPRKSSGPPQTWGKDLPEDFFERMELFARESLRRHAVLTERIRTEVAMACEKQLAVQHKLAPVDVSRVQEGLNDVCLPALFMPTPLGHTYTPRAHQYFHSSAQVPRVTQPPSIFKLPALPSPQKKMATINLFELGRHYSQPSYPMPMTEPEIGDSFVVPPPPPSACGHRKSVHFHK